jgi:hypothetical protein
MKHTARNPCPEYSLFLAGLSLAYFDLEDGMHTFLRNVVNFYWTSRRYIPDDRTLHYHWRENVKSNIVLRFLPYIQDRRKSDVLFFKKLITDASHNLVTWGEFV